MDKKTVPIDVREQIQEGFDMCGEESRKMFVSPARNHLFMTYDGEVNELDEEKRKICYKLLLLNVFYYKEINHGHRDNSIVSHDQGIKEQ